MENVVLILCVLLMFAIGFVAMEILFPKSKKKSGRKKPRRKRKPCNR